MNESQKRDAAYMASENEWLQWPYLAVVSRENHWEIGLMVSGKGPRVYVGLNVWSMGGHMIPQPKRVDTYGSYTECAEVWRVD